MLWLKLLILAQNFYVVWHPNLVNSFFYHAQAACDDVYEKQREPEGGISQKVVADAILGNIVGTKGFIQLQCKKRDTLASSFIPCRQLVSIFFWDNFSSVRRWRAKA